MGEQSLIERLKAATEGSRELDAEIECAVEAGWKPAGLARYAGLVVREPGGTTSLRHYAPTYSTSLDAIVGLIKRKLPGWWIQYLGQDLRGWATRIERQGVSLGLFVSPTPALALCIALLSALDGQNGSEAGDELAREGSVSGMNPKKSQQGGAEQ